MAADGEQASAQVSLHGREGGAAPQPPGRAAAVGHQPAARRRRAGAGPVSRRAWREDRELVLKPKAMLGQGYRLRVAIRAGGEAGPLAGLGALAAHRRWGRRGGAAPRPAVAPHLCHGRPRARGPGAGRRPGAGVLLAGWLRRRATAHRERAVAAQREQAREERRRFLLRLDRAEEPAAGHPGRVGPRGGRRRGAGRLARRRKGGRGSAAGRLGVLGEIRLSGHGFGGDSQLAFSGTTVAVQLDRG